MNIGHVLLASDLSPGSLQAYEHAVAIASKFEAKLTLLHVNELAEYELNPSPEMGPYMDAVNQQIGRRLEEDEAMLTELGVKPEIAVLSGIPSRQILGYVHDNDVDTVVLTRHGRSGARHLLLGSTVKRVIRHSHVPTVVVPTERDKVHKPFKGYGHILATTDFSSDSERGLEACVDFCKLVDARMTVVHVMRTPVPLTVLPGEPPIYLPREALEQSQKRREEELAQFLRQKGNDKVESWIAIDPDPARGIVQSAERLEADLIAVPSHGKGGVRAVLLGSTSERVVKMSPVAVMVLPRDYLEAA